MAIDKNSTGFTLLFAVLMVIVVGAVLASLAFSLQPMQKKNAEDKKKMDILASIGLDGEKDGADDIAVKRSNVNEVFPQFITEYYILDHTGAPMANVTEKDVLAVDVKKQHRNTTLTKETKKYPLYGGKTPGGKQVYVVPMVGKGLWGPIWGYVAMETDMKTVFGASFDHKTETPGLGAEIKTSLFEDAWPGQEFNYTAELYFEVTKGAGSSSGKHEVDGITGGTITSKGVQEMVNRSMEVYKNFNSSKAQLN